MAEMYKLSIEWEKLSKILEKSSRKKNWEKSLDWAMSKEATRLRKLVRKGIVSQAPGGKKFQKLSHMTIAMRKATGGRVGKKALVSTGKLGRSIKSKKISTNLWVVGVDDKAKSGGKKLSDIAAIHEYGADNIKIVVNDKVRKFFLAVHIKTRRSWRPPKKGRKGGRKPKYMIMPLKKSTGFIAIKIPARPFLGPVFDAERSRMINNVVNDTIRHLGFPRK